ncbi:MAG: TRIC cation channel family protein, partial [Brachybacterium sp.]|nr:TRIC cation channel family protein [Brachybacterium sp.]
FVVHAEGPLWRHLMSWMDALALGLWAATGTSKALSVGLDALPAVLLGVVSAVGGGAIRDIMVGRVPAIFTGGPLYATSALLTAATTWIGAAIGLPYWTVLIAASLGSGLALLAQWRQWGLPQHREWQVTFSASQMKALVRRVRRSERRRIAATTGTIPVVDPGDAFSTDTLVQHESADDYARDAFDLPDEHPKP